MSETVYEFPLNEKVRTYLRLEQLFMQLNSAKRCSESWQFMDFFECLFTLLDLLERVDLRNDMLKDIDVHEKNLIYWSQHPKINQEALQEALQSVIRLRDALKNAKKVGSGLKEERLLQSIRQRFSIPGATCSFDLPNLHYWLKQPEDIRQADMNRWISEFLLIHRAVEVTLSFLRERGKFQNAIAPKGFYQGAADGKHELIRIRCATNQNYYPTLSGNKYRYAIRFVRFTPDGEGRTGVEEQIAFTLSCC